MNQWQKHVVDSLRVGFTCDIARIIRIVLMITSKVLEIDAILLRAFVVHICLNTIDSGSDVLPNVS